jgi:DNA-binding IclR family transcriptional regulator
MGAVSQSVARAVDIMELLADNGALGVRDVARRMELSPTIVHRLLATLASTGFAEQAADTQKYRIGYRAFRVGSTFLSQNDLDSASAPEMAVLAERHQINCFLGVLRDRSMVYLKMVRSNGPIAINSPAGSLALPHATAFGKIMLASLPDKQVAEVLGREPFKKQTKKTKTTLRSLMTELRDVRQTGIAISDEENLVNVYSVGFAVRDASGTVVASLSGAVPRQGLTRREIDRLCALVKEAADNVSRKMGAPPSSLASRGR